MIIYSTDGMVAQRFPFRSPIMHHILKNVQPQHLLKLYQSCKFFYHKIGVNVIQNLEIVADNEPEICSSTFNSLRVSTLSKFNDSLITESFVLRSIVGTFPVFSRYAITKLELINDINFRAFQRFTKDGNIKELKIKGVVDDDDFTVYFGIEDILAMVPNASSVEISECIITQTTFTSLVELKHKAKFSNFVLKNIVFEHFDKAEYYSLTDFLLKNANYNCNVYLDFQPVPELNAHDRFRNMGLKVMAFLYRKSIAKALFDKKMMDLIKENMMMILFFFYCVFIFYS